MYVNKSQMISLFHFSALCDIFRKKNFQKFQIFSKKNVLRFLSFGYSAHFKRSRLVSTNDTKTTLPGYTFVARAYTDLDRSRLVTKKSLLLQRMLKILLYSETMIHLENKVRNFHMKSEQVGAISKAQK